MEDVKKELGNKLIAFRNEKKITREELAKCMGVSMQQMYRIEREDASVKAEELGRIAKTYNASIDRLLEIDEGNRLDIKSELESCLDKMKKIYNKIDTK